MLSYWPTTPTEGEHTGATQAMLYASIGLATATAHPWQPSFKHFNASNEDEIYCA